MRNQNSIKNNFPGQWAIVSTYQSETADNNRHNDFQLEQYAVRAAANVGPTAIVAGCWDGKVERSLWVHGVGAANLALRLAIRFQQEAFIVAPGDGTARLLTRNVDGTYSETQRFESIEETSAAVNHTALPSGLRFRFV